MVDHGDPPMDDLAALAGMLVSLFSLVTDRVTVGPWRKGQSPIDVERVV
jgi:hypothetical protein